MQNEPFTESSSEKEARIARFLSMSDAQNARNIASDPDAQIPNDPAFLGSGKWVTPDAIIIPAAYDKESIHWLDRHGVDCQKLLPTLLREYISRQDRTLYE
jgi:hypothetical protein